MQGLGQGRECGSAGEGGQGSSEAEDLGGKGKITQILQDLDAAHGAISVYNSKPDIVKPTPPGWLWKG